MSVEQEEPSGRVTAGIDWASEDHAVAIVDDTGVAIDRFQVAHTAPELRRLVSRLRRAGVMEVAIERPDGPVVDALLDAELMVIVIAPNQLKNLRSRYGSAGNKDDRFDAYVLADVLRTLDDLVAAGKVLHIGCSNLAGWQLGMALATSDLRG